MGNPKVTSGVITLKDQGGGVWGSVPGVPYTPPSITSEFARFVDEALGSDANDGNLVSNGGTGPWATFEHAVQNVSPGNALYLVNTINPTADVVMKNFPNAGTIDNRITVLSHPDFPATLDLSLTSTLLRLFDRQEYWDFKDFSVINCGSFCDIGQDLASYNITFDNLIIRMNQGGDNAAPIVMRELAEDITINGCDIEANTPPGTGVNQSQCLVMFRPNKIKITNNILTNSDVDDFHLSMNFKAANDPNQPDTNILMENNYITAQIKWNGNNAVIRNNVVIGTLRMNEASGVPGGDFCTLEHNTIIGDLFLSSATQSGDPNPGATNNTIINNVLTGSCDVWPNASGTGNNITNYNLYGGTPAFNNNSTPYTLAEWQGFNGTDANSLQGSPVFVNPPTGYGLQNGTIGTNSASDGADMGVNMSEVAG